MKVRRFVVTACMAVFSMLAGATSHATVTAYFVLGATCGKSTQAKFPYGGPEFKLSLCLSSTEESICGHSLQLEAASPASSGQFEVLKHVMGVTYPDPTLEKQSGPIAITNPGSQHDFGGTRDKPAPPTKDQLLATFSLRANTKAKPAAYELRLGKNSVASVGKDGSCLQNTEIPLAASIQINRQ